MTNWSKKAKMTDDEIKKQADKPEHPIGKYYEYWEKSQFCPFEDEVILKNKSK